MKTRVFSLFKKIKLTLSIRLSTDVYVPWHVYRSHKSLIVYFLMFRLMFTRTSGVEE